MNAKRSQPNWTRDELILAIDLYFRTKGKSISPSHPGVVELSQVLRRLPIHPGAAQDSTFRNADSVHYRLGNFKSLDRTHVGKGLDRIGPFGISVWNEFASDPELVARLAAVIRVKYSGSKATLSEALDDDEIAFPEGRLLYRLHRARERSSKLVQMKKRRAAEAGGIRCEACGFDFLATYGEDFIECHHTVPISEYEEGRKTKLEELALVCANCHRMLHRKRPWMTVAELRQRIAERVS